MIEPAARAARPESGPPAGFYTWEVPGKPVAVAIPFSLIDQLDGEVVQNSRSLSSRGSEIGGLLFGTVAQGTPTLVTINSYAQVICDYGLGPLYRLSEVDLSRLDVAIAEAVGRGATPVGFFRSHTRKGLSLDPADRKLLGLRFAHPHCVALLVRPSAAKASTAGIFIWENGDVQCEASHLEFPFRASELTSSLHSASTAGRARIVPIASRREPAPLKREDAPMAFAPPELPSPRPQDLELVPRPTAKGRGRFYMFLSAIAASGISLLFLANSGALRRDTRIAPVVAANPLSLHVERRTGEVLLTWDLDSQAIPNASRAVLEISDGPRRQNVFVDRMQLRHGSIVYSPATGDVVFKMDVMGGDQKVVSESLRVLSAPPISTASNIMRAIPQPKLDKSAPITTPAVRDEAGRFPARPGAKTTADPALDAETPPTPQLISRTEPEYPDIAREAGIKGPVKLVATVGSEGRVKSVKPVSGDSLLIGPATDAIMQWLYQPAIRNGVPVESETEIVLNFTVNR